MQAMQSGMLQTGLLSAVLMTNRMRSRNTQELMCTPNHNPKVMHMKQHVLHHSRQCLNSSNLQTRLANMVFCANNDALQFKTAEF